MAKAGRPKKNKKKNYIISREVTDTNSVLLMIAISLIFLSVITCFIGSALYVTEAHIAYPLAMTGCGVLILWLLFLFNIVPELSMIDRKVLTEDDFDEIVDAEDE